MVGSSQVVPVAASVLSQEPSVPSVDSSPNISVESVEDQREQGRQRWLDTLTPSNLRQKQESDTLKASESNGSSNSSVHFSYGKKHNKKKRNRDESAHDPSLPKKMQRQ